MTNSTSALRGFCPPPFYDASKFGMNGFVAGRFCAPIDQIHHGLICCLPCPLTDYIYTKDFNTWYRVAEGLNVGGLICLLLLLITFIVLPAEKTRRHYLSFCLVIAAIFMAIGFVIPFGATPDQCHDEITPNDMYSSLMCAFSGAFLIAGGLSMAVWIFIRALSMHLQICWDVIPGKKFFYCSQGFGWAVVATFFTTTVTITGVSFQFGDVCHVNGKDSMKDFWGPLLAIAGAATVIQVGTFAYCIKVYLQNICSEDHIKTHSSTDLPSYTTSVRTRSAGIIYRRVREVLWLQWRSIAIVVFILVDVIFFSVVFVSLNSISIHAMKDFHELEPYLFCLIRNPADPSPCFEMGQALTVDESTVIAILMMLSIAGLQVFLLQLRKDMFTGWVDFSKEKFLKISESLSLDIKNTEQPRNYELRKCETISPITAPTAPVFTSCLQPKEYVRSGRPEQLSRDVQRAYKSPTLSFSTTRPPSQSTTNMNRDPRSPHARSGLGLQPPVEEKT